MAGFAAGAIGTFFALSIFGGVAAASVLNRTGALQLSSVNSLQWVVLVALSTPVLGLTVVSARLLAAARELRLARLRLLGLTVRQTRVVAAVDVGAPFLAGAVVAAISFLLTRPFFASVLERWLQFPQQYYHPGVLGWLASVVGLLTVCVAVGGASVSSAFKARATSARAGQPVRLGWRFAVLGLGISGMAILLYAQAVGRPLRQSVWLYPVSAALISAAVFVCTPILASLVGRLLARGASRPVVLLAGRRLMQRTNLPGRVIPPVLVAIFLTAVLAPLLNMYLDDPVFKGDQRAATSGPQIFQVQLERGADQETAARLLMAHGVTRTAPFTLLRPTACGTSASTSGDCRPTVVTTCWGLKAAGLNVNGCRDGISSTLVPTASEPSVLVLSQNGEEPSLRVITPRDSMSWTRDPSVLTGDDIAVFIASSTPSAENYLQHRPTGLIIEGPGGIEAEDKLEAVLRERLPKADVTTTRAFANYVTIRNIEAVLQLTLGSLLILGLLAFLLAIGSQISERRVVAAPLLVIGVSRSVLQRAQLLETLAPLLVGVPAAAALGWFTSRGLPHSSALLPTPVVVAGLLVIALAAVAGLVASVMSVPKIDPTVLRRS